MKKFLRICAVFAAAAVLGLGMMSCDYWNEDWYKNGEGSASESSDSATYAGALAVNGTSYVSLAMNGTSSSGTAVLSGSAGNASGTYSNSGSGRAASTLNLSGRYTLTFGFGTIIVVFTNTTATLSADSVSASGTASITTAVATPGGVRSGAIAEFRDARANLTECLYFYSDGKFCFYDFMNGSYTLSFEKPYAFTSGDFTNGEVDLHFPTPVEVHHIVITNGTMYMDPYGYGMSSGSGMPPSTPTPHNNDPNDYYYKFVKQ